jgi:glycogen phosphorylase
MFMASSKSVTFQEAKALAREIKKVAYNLWWTWNVDARDLFRELSPQTYARCNHNVIVMFEEISDQELAARLLDPLMMERAINVVNHFMKYMSDTNTWAKRNAKELKSGPVAYFSAEFGIHESLPTYSGGLGILAGDHSKSASDLGIPFIGVSLYYRQGYFTQQLSPDGWQQESYPNTDPKRLPLELVTDSSGQAIVSSVTVGHSEVFFHAYRINLGRVSILLLDTNRDENEQHYREILSQVYGGDITTRVSQEIILGVGGVRMLRAMGISPSVFHANEGHPAFLTIELLRELIVDKKFPMDKAVEWVRRHTVFTTHTPVAAGHDRFPEDLIRFIMHKYVDGWLRDTSDIVHLGRVHPEDSQEPFCMTVLALKMSRAANGVSELHGRVSRKCGSIFFPENQSMRFPSGISRTVSISRAGHLHERTGSGRIPSVRNGVIISMIRISGEELKILHSSPMKKYGHCAMSCGGNLLNLFDSGMQQQSIRYGTDPGTSFDRILSTDALTIGFARRFATYKRAPLFFRDMARAKKILLNPDYPIQIIFSGKAHPRDDAGKRFIQQIVGISRDPELFGRVAFLENYDINAGRLLVSGSDIWLNNPRRPLEASGTSGQKTAIHGGLNLSILDGWWREGYDGKNGWAIGRDEHSDNVEEQDAIDAENLYTVLENQVIPEFYDRRGNGLPRKWLKRVRHAMATLIPRYNTDRMVEEYVKKYYIDKKKS